MEKRSIVVIGLGGVGGYFGFKINQRNEKERLHHVTYVARGRTYEVVRKSGLTLLSPEHAESVTRPDAVLQSISEIKNPDLVLICVKEYDLENVCRQLTDVISNSTLLLPLMNGADIYDRIRRVIPDEVILPSCVYVASHIKEKGVVEHKGKAGKLIYGKDPYHLDADMQWVSDLMEASGIDFEAKEDPMIDIWTKFIFIASFGLVTAKHNSSIGAVCTDGNQRAEAKAVMEEIRMIAQRKGIQLPEDIAEKTFVKAATFPATTPTSLQLDVHSGKEHTELELFAGAVLEFGAALNVDTNETRTIYMAIKKGN